MVMVFLKLMHTRDVDKHNLEVGEKHASKIAAKVGELLGTNKTAIYNAYKEWKEGGESWRVTMTAHHNQVHFITEHRGITRDDGILETYAHPRCR